MTKKTGCINKCILATCHEIGGAAMPHIVMANLAHACCFTSSVCDGIDTAGSLPENTLVMKYLYDNDDFRGLTFAQGAIFIPHSYRIFFAASKNLEPHGFWGFHNCPVDCADCWTGSESASSEKPDEFRQDFLIPDNLQLIVPSGCDTLW